MSESAADEPVPGFNFRVSWGDRQIASISSISALRLDAGVSEEMQPGPVEFTRARSVDDAFEAWAADPAPKAVTVNVLSAGGVPSLTFLLEDSVPVSYIALDGLDADSAEMARERLVVRCQAIRRVPAGEGWSLKPRSTEQILAHADELARRFAEHQPDGDGVKDARALRNIAAAIGRRAGAERDIAAAVAVARAEGHTWAAIGAMLGTSGEAARQRYGPGASQSAHEGRRGGQKAARRSA